MSHQTNSKNTEVSEWLEKLKEKYHVTGQDINSYLEGLYYSDFVNYWEYINLEALLNLQHPKTTFEDEQIFIVYHQITELYFKLTLHELNQIAEMPGVDWNAFDTKVKRMKNYFEALVQSFTIMIDGMDKDQFRKFRMALLPASGFQSVQYRKIELTSTDLINLVDLQHRASSKQSSLEEQFKHIYWKQGATELATGKQTLTLTNFIKKYGEELLTLAKKRFSNNLSKKYINWDLQIPANENTKRLLREYDLLVNVRWPLAHIKSAGRFLVNEPDVIAATGGTNWMDYLPPQFQKRIFFPFLWGEDQKATWGKNSL